MEQEAAYPIPISLYNCYRTVRHEKRGIAIILRIAFLMPHGPVTVVQRYRDGVCSLHLEEILIFGCANAPKIYRLFAITVDTYLSLFSNIFRYVARGDRTRTATTLINCA